MTYKFLIAVLAMAIPLRASTSFNTLASMEAANPGLTLTPVSFDPLGQNSYTPTLAMSGGLAFTAVGIPTITTTFNPGGSWPAGDILKGATTGGTITITLPTAALAFGASFGEVEGSVTGITVSVTDGSGLVSYSITPSSGQPVYLGISTTSAFTSISFTTGFSFSKLAVNNFSYETAETPEVGTMILIGTGLVILSAIRRRVAKWRLRPAAVRSE
jgi:hypothetical protein